MAALPRRRRAAKVTVAGLVKAELEAMGLARHVHVMGLGGPHHNQSQSDQPNLDQFPLPWEPWTSVVWDGRATIRLH